MSKQRINKVLAAQGVASRRAIEDMILEGRITVNGELINKLPCFVDLDVDDVRVDEKKVRSRSGGTKTYFLLNKPRGVVCTQNDPSGRRRAVDFLPPTSQRLYPVGRLDIETTGLLVLTNDGDLTEYLTHPSHGVVKTYVAEVDGRVGGDQLDKLRKGVYLDAGRTQGAGVKVLRRNPERTSIEIKISEGRNREVRRILAGVGYKVKRLKRVAIGPITDRGLKIGSVRELTPGEVARLAKCGQQTTITETAKKTVKRKAAEIVARKKVAKTTFRKTTRKTVSKKPAEKTAKRAVKKTPKRKTRKRES